MTTIRDVARKLNLSITTISRALDGYIDVAPGTRQKVIETAQAMGYSPNRAARQLRKQKAETIGFILPSSVLHINEPFFTEFISGLGDALSEKNFDLLVANATSDEQERNFYERWINGRKVDGMVLTRIQMHDWRVQYLAGHDFPFSALGKSRDAVEYPHIDIDGKLAYLELIQHLKSKDFLRFAFIGGHDNLITHINQIEWFASALQVCGLTFDPNLVLSADLTSHGGYQAAKQLFEMSEPPEVVLCINDETAFGVLHAAHERGLIIGSGLAVAGFDGVHESRYTEPPLTTLDIPVYDIARLLAEMVLKKINKESLETENVIIHPNLLVRASTNGAYHRSFSEKQP